MAWRSFSSHPKALFSFELNFVLPMPSPVGFTQRSSLREPSHKANLERKKTNSNIWVCVGVNNSITYSFFFLWVTFEFCLTIPSMKTLFSQKFSTLLFLNSWINHKTLFFEHYGSNFCILFFFKRMLCVLGILIQANIPKLELGKLSYVDMLSSAGRHDPAKTLPRRVVGHACLQCMC